MAPGDNTVVNDVANAGLPTVSAGYLLALRLIDVADSIDLALEVARA